MEKFKQPKYYDTFTIKALYLFSLLGFWFVYKASPSPSRTGYGNGNIIFSLAMFFVIPSILIANLYLNRELQKWHFYRDLEETHLQGFILLVLIVFLACIGGEIWFTKNLVNQLRANPNLAYEGITFDFPRVHENPIYFNAFTFVGSIALTLLIGSVKQYFSFRSQAKN